MAPINIHTVEPKFLRRALKNGAMLHFHHPFLFIIQSIGLTVLLLLAESNVLSLLGFMFFTLLFTWSFVCLRAGDSENSLYDIIVAAARDIYGVLKYSVMLSLIVAAALFSFFLIWHTIVPHTGHVAHTAASVYTHGVYSKSYSTTMLSLTVFMFGTLFLSIAMVPYLAMYYGYIGFNLLYHITTLGVSKNWHTLGSMLVVACICSVFDIAVTAGLPTASDMLFVFLFDALSFVIYNTILYLLCREIFEGRGKNVEVKQAEPQLKHATAA